MPKINVYLSEELAAAVKEAQVPVSAVCQAALERAVRDITAARGSDQPPQGEGERRGLFSRFTPRARHAVKLGEEAARAVPHDYVGTEHVLLGVIDEGGNLALKVLESLDIEPDDVRAELIASMGPPTAAPVGHIPFNAMAKHVLELALKEALTLGHNYIGCEHVLLGLVGADEGLASQVLRRMGVELRTTRRAVITTLAGVVHGSSTAAPHPSPSIDPAVLDEILRRLIEIEGRLPD
jgi:ATP-dependent Clp protease ATP-binding subunit ClpC